MAEFHIPRGIHNLPDEFLAAGIMGMGFTRKNDLDGVIGIIEDSFSAEQDHGTRGLPAYR